MIASRIIGHRGAAGLALENTLPSFKKAIAAGTTTIEFDVHTTLDGVFVVCHDYDLGRVSGNPVRVNALTAEELAAIPLSNGTSVPRLTEVLELLAAHGIRAIVELKDVNNPTALCELLDTFGHMGMIIASFNHSLVAEIRTLRPGFKTYLARNYRPLNTLRKARKLGASGVDLHYTSINPIIYWLARRWQLELMVFTVNNGLLGRLLLWMYPDIAICTNYPDRFIPRQRSGS